MVEGLVAFEAMDFNDSERAMRYCSIVRATTCGVWTAIDLHSFAHEVSA